MSVSLNRSAPLFAGTGLTISCTVTLDSSVNNDEAVSTHWSGQDHIVPPERYSVTPAMRGSNGSYTGTLTISPLAEGDDGTLSCTGTVTGGTESQSANSTSITVAGKTIVSVIFFWYTFFSLYLSPDLPSPVVMVSTASVGPMAVGERLELTCSMAAEEHLTPSAELSIEWSGGSVGGSGVVESETRAVNETTSERTLIFSSLNTSHGGQCTCQAVVYIYMIGLMKTGNGSREFMVQSEYLSLTLVTVDVSLSPSVPRPVVMVTPPQRES